MAISLDVGKTTSDYNRLDKNYTRIELISAVIKEGTSIINPTFVVNTFSGYHNCNYIKCPELGRNYYVNNIELVPGGRLALQCHVDVLSSFKDGIRSCTCIIDKQENDHMTSPYINDGSYVMLCKAVNQSYNFPSGFSQKNTILITAGGN